MFMSKIILDRTGEKMSGRIRKSLKVLLYAVSSNAIFGSIIFFTYTWLAGYSVLYAYLGNLALIIIGLLMDEHMIKSFQSKKLAMQLNQIEKVKDRELNYRIIKGVLNSFVSFKTVLYTLYILILILAQIIDFYPSLFSEDMRSFILANNYSILIIVAFDLALGEFFRDRKKSKDALEKLNNNLNEVQD